MNLPEILANLARARARDDATNRRTHNAMAPVTKYVGVVASICTAAVCYLPKDDPLRNLFAAVGCFSVVVGVLAFVYFTLWKPDRLQTEDYLTSNRQLDIVAEKAGRVTLNPVDLAALGAPYQLTPPAQEPDADEDEEGDRGA